MYTFNLFKSSSNLNFVIFFCIFGFQNRPNFEFGQFWRVNFESSWKPDLQNCPTFDFGQIWKVDYAILSNFARLKFEFSWKTRLQSCPTFDFSQFHSLKFAIWNHFSRLNFEFWQKPEFQNCQTLIILFHSVGVRVCFRSKYVLYTR